MQVVLCPCAACLQNLANAHMIIWAPQVDKLIVANKSKELFEEFSDYVSVRRFDYDDVITGTPFKGDPYFGNGTLVKQMMPDAGSFSDIVRILTLNKYGGEPCELLISCFPGVALNPNPNAC